MDTENLLKLVLAGLSVLTSIYALYKGVLSDRFSTVGRLRDDYKFAKEFFSELTGPKEMNAFQKAKGYQALAGVNWIGIDEGDYLTSLKDPAKALDRYVKGHEHLIFVPSSAGGPQVAFQPHLLKSWSRSWRKWAYVAAYVVSFVLAIWPLFFGAWLVSNPSQWILTMGISAAVFGPSAAIALNAIAKIVAAERLVTEQLPIKSSGLISYSGL